MTSYFADDVENNTDLISTPMRGYFKGKTVLLTGGSGFLGQLFVEKLLRTGVRCIYLLIREKKGKSPKDRIRELYSGPLFVKLRKIDRNYFDKITPIEGDIEKVNLGLSDSVLLNVQDTVEIIIHAAADVRFDQILTKIIGVNVKGTKELLKLAEIIKNLEVFTYISTAYSNCPRDTIEEKFYEPNIDPEIMIKFVQKYSTDRRVEVLQDRISIPWPNNYTYSKSLAEELVRRYGRKFPVCVVRPTIVISTYKDPIPAWCNNIYGLNGILVACGMGVLRLFPSNRKCIGDIVCADFVINSALATAWTTYEESRNGCYVKSDPQIYHISSYYDAPLTWGEINDRMKKVFSEFPAKDMLWKECPNSTICPFLMKILTIYYHVIPAIFFDMYLKLTKQQIRLMPVYRKVQRFLGALKHFMSKQWKFTNHNMHTVLSRMTTDDQYFFPCDIRRFNWNEYSYDYNQGLKLYIANDSPDNVAKARMKYKKLVYLHYTVLFFYYLAHLSLCYITLKYFKIVKI